LPDARTKADAERFAGDPAVKNRRAREGLEVLPPDRSFTVGKLIRWWLDTWKKGTLSERQEEDRFRLYFKESDLAAVPVAALTSGRVDLFLNSFRERLGPESINKMRAIPDGVEQGPPGRRARGREPDEDVPRRKVPQCAPAFLELGEVPRLLPELRKAKPRAKTASENRPATRDLQRRA